MRDHTKLRAFELADQLTLAIYKETRSFPREEMFGLTSQLRRAAVSIASNIVEGSARFSEAEHLHFLDAAYGAAREVEYQVSLAARLGFLDASSQEGPECAFVGNQQGFERIIALPAQALIRLRSPASSLQSVHGSDAGLRKCPLRLTPDKHSQLPHNLLPIGRLRMKLPKFRGLQTVACEQPEFQGKNWLEMALDTGLRKRRVPTISCEKNQCSLAAPRQVTCGSGVKKQFLINTTAPTVRWPMNDAPMETTFLVEEVGMLHQGKVALAGISRGQPIKPGMRAFVATASGQLTVEVISIGIVDPPPTNPNKKLVQVRISGGDVRSLKSYTLQLRE